MIIEFFEKLLSHITSIFFPKQCYICKNNTTPTTICEACFHSFPKAITAPSPFIESIYSFKDPRIKKIIHAIKYFHRKDLIIPCSNKLSEVISKEINHHSYVLVPIPMPVLRKYIRGYNHTEQIAKAVSLQLQIPVMDNILKENSSKHSRRQVTTRSRKDRILNKRNAFITNKDVTGFNIILIDDVTTTGATLREARKVLLQHGALSVVAFTFAH